MGREQGSAVVLASLVGALGLLPGAAGGLDPVALSAWTALCAPAAGLACGAAGVRLAPYGLAVPAVWTFLLVWADAGSERDLPTPLWSSLAVAGLFALGLGLGGARARGAAASAGPGAILVAGLVLSGLCVQGGLGRPGTTWGRSAPRLGALAVDVSPVVLVLECAGLDPTHSHPEIYAVSGIEWRPRRPWRGILAGPTLLVVGCLAGVVLPRRARQRVAARARAAT